MQSFLRYGQIHRNTYICVAACCWIGSLRVEECIRGSAVCGADFGRGGIHGIDCDGDAGGAVCGRGARWMPVAPVPRGTALGSLVHYITHADVKHFQPANITFDLLEPLEEETAEEGARQAGAAPDGVRAGA